MTGLPTSLAIALWSVGTLWLIGILAYAFDEPVEIVWATFIVGLIIGLLEWLIRKKRER